MSAIRSSAGSSSPGGTQYDADIVGATRCEKRPKRCDLSGGIVADDAARTVTFHLVSPDPEFLYKCAPLGTRASRNAASRSRPGSHPPLRGTGPYMITSYRPNHILTLERNPYFHEWSKAAQPDGYPDEIMVEIGGTPDHGGQGGDQRQGGRLQHRGIREPAVRR